jgi:methionyl-tRNA synthetase
LAAAAAVTAANAAMARIDLAGAATAAMDLVRAIDGYIERTAPFRIAKDPARAGGVGSILYDCAETLRIASVLLWPFMPAKVEELWQRLGCEAYAEALARSGRGDLAAWTKWGLGTPGTPVVSAEPLFPRFVAPRT